jgi:hypothetical protein
MDAGTQDQADTDQNSFTNRLAREHKKHKYQGSTESSDAGDAGSAVGQLALAYFKGYGIGADFDELHRGGQKDKITSKEDQAYKEREKEKPKDKP